MDPKWLTILKPNALCCLLTAGFSFKGEGKDGLCSLLCFICAEEEWGTDFQGRILQRNLVLCKR